MKIRNKVFSILISSLALLILTLCFTSITVTASNKIPDPTSYKYVNDYTNTLKDSEIKDIISIGKELEDKTGAQAVTVIINSTDGVPIDNYAIDLFRTWGIGQKTKDNGLLIVVAIQDRTWRVEVGRGLEGAIPDVLTNRVMESIAKPNFKKGDYGKGLAESYSTFADYIAKEYDVKLTKSLNVQLPNNLKNTSSDGDFTILGIIIAFILIDVIFNKSRICRAILKILLLINFTNRNGPGGFGGGSSSGGFGGFGGGSSNGGGSSGSW